MGLISRVSSRTYRNLKKPYQKITMPLAVDLLHPSLACEKAKHKKKRLVQAPNSFFMDVKCPDCRRLPRMQQHHEPTYWWQSSIDFWLQLPKEAKQVSINLKHAENNLKIKQFFTLNTRISSSKLIFS